MKLLNYDLTTTYRKLHLIVFFLVYQPCGRMTCLNLPQKSDHEHQSTVVKPRIIYNFYTYNPIDYENVSFGVCSLIHS